MSKHLIELLCITAVVSLSVTGCTKFHTADVQDGYSTDFSRSPAEYSIYMSEKVTTATNILYTRMITASNVIKGSYSLEDELENTTDDISKIGDLIDTLTTTMPPQEYESDRQSLLDQLGQVKTNLENYKTHLELKDKAAISSDISIIEADALALGGESNISYK